MYEEVTHCPYRTTFGSVCGAITCVRTFKTPYTFDRATRRLTRGEPVLINEKRYSHQGFHRAEGHGDGNKALSSE